MTLTRRREANDNTASGLKAKWGTFFICLFYQYYTYMSRENLPPPFDLVAINLNWKLIIENFKGENKSQNSLKTEFLVTLFILLYILFWG